MQRAGLSVPQRGAKRGCRPLGRPSGRERGGFQGAAGRMPGPGRALAALAAAAAVAVSGAWASARGEAAPEAVSPDRYDVVWTTPSRDSSGSMPLGNGDIGLNLWVEPTGDLVFYISKTDAWDAHCRLLKVGRVRVRLEPNPVAEGGPFRQRLRLGRGEVEITAGPEGRAARWRVWVDANRPVVRVEVESDRPATAEAVLELWRTKPYRLEGRQRDSARGVLKGGDAWPLVVSPDHVVDAGPDRLVWYHRNERSCWPITMKVQGLEGLVAPSADPLIGRTFGGCLRGEGMVRKGPMRLRSEAPRRRHLVSVYVLTRQPATEREWLVALRKVMAEADATDLDEARRAHRAWWGAFWRRSFIHAEEGARWAPAATTNDLPLRIGADSEGQNRFVGAIARPMVFARALSAEEVARLARRPERATGGKAAGGADEALLRDPALVGCWTLQRRTGDAFANEAALDLPARIVGRVEVVDAPVGKAVRLDGGGYLEVADHPRLDLTQAMTLAAWVLRAPEAKRDGRILDKSKAGTSNGYLLDTWPGGGSVRLIVAPGTLVEENVLVPGRWTHLAATFGGGVERLWVDGRLVAERRLGGHGSTVSQGYALQRFINACGGRGAMPIKFNGTIFTVDAYGDPDYRRWGGCYWWQNTRFPYWSMIRAGDWDLMQPLFRMYREALPLAKAITRRYFGHGGAYFPETMYFWGTPCNDDYGWKRNGHPASLMLNRYIRRLWEGGIELTMMMLDVFDHTGDEAFLRETLLPHADAIATFYAEHYPREADGRLRIEPAQALESWWEAVNPMPEVAGLRAVLPRLLALPAHLTTAEQRGRWRRLLESLPPVPTRQVDGRRILAAAERFSSRHNSENPELYAIWPYRLYGVGLADLDVALGAWEHRLVKRTGGWTQDPIQAACLGLTATAADFTARNFATHHAGSRFPAFWGPNFDWVPDQDHGCVSMIALQSMLLQTRGRKILLLPAWPRAWDVHFKLHAPYRTTVECVWRRGRVECLEVNPPARRADVVLPED